jgi:hypothetical protein
MTSKSFGNTCWKVPSLLQSGQTRSVPSTLQENERSGLLQVEETSRRAVAACMRKQTRQKAGRTIRIRAKTRTSPRLGRIHALIASVMESIALKSVQILLKSTSNNLTSFMRTNELMLARKRYRSTIRRRNTRSFDREWSFVGDNRRQHPRCRSR